MTFYEMHVNYYYNLHRYIKFKNKPNISERMNIWKTLNENKLRIYRHTVYYFYKYIIAYRIYLIR